MTSRIAYFAHDLADPAVHRRARMLRAGGAAVTPIGFHRTQMPPTSVAGRVPLSLGRTIEGRLASRALSVLTAIAKLGDLAGQVADMHVIMARNLEMLAIASMARRRYAPSARLIYECLDIHGMMIANNPIGGFLRLLESRLGREVDLLLTSSPAFERNYFAVRRFHAAVKLVENKLLLLEDDPAPAPESRPGAPPWRIGWFGMIRCRRSLEILRALTQSMRGDVEVVIRGRPSPAVFSNFEEAIAGMPYIHYGGPFDNPADLAHIYGDVHFAWAIDYYEHGSNSAWLLPNRIYEGPSFGAVPIGVAHVETGRWLAEHGIGVVLGEPLEQELHDFFRQLSAETYVALTQAITALPRTAFICGRDECRDLVDAVYRGPTVRATIERNDHANGIVLRGGAS
jgi:succinoglycan biosynthesis protein ExoL